MPITETMKALVAWRKSRGKDFSQSKAAAELGVSVRTLQNWEIGRNEPRGFAKKQLLAIISPKPRKEK